MTVVATLMVVKMDGSEVGLERHGLKPISR